MKKIYALGLFCILLVGCTKQGQVKTIDAKAAKKMMDETAVILDVRTKMEYEDGHISGAINIPVDSILEGNSKLPDLDETILVYCKSGNRSKEASQKLVDMGYKNVYNFGGIDNWPYGVESALTVSSQKSIKEILSAFKLQYIDSLTSDSLSLPLTLTCQKEACTYAGKTLPITGTVPTSLEITLKEDGTLSDAEAIINGLSCEINGKTETVACK